MTIIYEVARKSCLDQPTNSVKCSHDLAWRSSFAIVADFFHLIYHLIVLMCIYSTVLSDVERIATDFVE